jgi:hypothetical protein
MSDILLKAPPYEELLAAYKELVTARKRKRQLSPTPVYSHLSAKRYTGLPNKDYRILMEESENNKALKGRTPEKWVKVLLALPESARERVANILWWDYLIPELSEFTSVEPTEVPEEDLARYLYLCGYSKFRSVARSKSQEDY